MLIGVALLCVLLSAPGCATWEEKLDQRSKWKKFREENNQSPRNGPGKSEVQLVIIESLIQAYTAHYWIALCDKR